MGMTWTPEQKAVIDLRERNILVSAAAGSGKTAVLVERIVGMLTDAAHPIDIDQLLVVTFTKAAAGEMRERIGRAIDGLLEKNPEDEHLMRQQTLIYNAQITTIDSFCNDILHNYFHLIGLDPDYRVADEGEQKLLKADVMEMLLEEKFAQDSKEFQQFVDSYAVGRDDKELGNYILRLYEFSMSHPWPEEWLESCLTPYEAGSVEEMLESSWASELMGMIRKTLQDVKKMAEKALEICYEAGGPWMYGEALESDADLVAQYLRCDNYEELGRAFSGRGKYAVLSRKKDETVLDEKRELVKQIRDQMKKRLEGLEKQYFTSGAKEQYELLTGSQENVRMLVELAIAFSRRYQEAKREKNLLDFPDMEHLALEILTQRTEEGLVQTEAAKELALRYEEIMIDEYQDSNEVQELILTSISGAGRGKKNIFMVGDVKQSIYRFRMARPELFMEKYQKYSTQDGEEQRIDLHKNFRSREEVLTGANKLFSCLMTRRMGGIVYDEDAALNPGAEYPETHGENRSELLLLDLEEDPEGAAEAEENERELEARMVGTKILEMVGKQEVYDKETGEMRKARFGDVVILLRTISGWAESFLKVLHTMGIPGYTGTRTGYFSSVEIQTVLSFLKILDNPRQDIALTAVLASPIGNFSSRELALVKSSGAEGDFYTVCRSYLDQGTDEKLKEKLMAFFDMLDEFRSWVPYLPMHELLWRIFDRTGYADYAAAMPGGEQRTANLRMLEEKAAAYEETSYRGLYNFVRYIENLRKAEIDYGEANIGGEEADTVNIMSIHKSKGLEFPIVFVCGLHKSFNRMDVRSRVILHPDLGLGCDYTDPVLRVRIPLLMKRFLQKKTDEDNLSEELRVLYVALTRAKEKLILTGVLKGTEKKLSLWNQNAPDEEGLSYTALSGAENCLDWIMPVVLSNSNGPFDLQFVTIEGLVKEEVKGQVSLQMAGERLLKRKTEEEEAPVKQAREEIERLFSWKYPFEAGRKSGGQLTVSELKKMGMEEEEAGTVLIDVPPEPLIPAFRKKDIPAKGAALGTIYHKILEKLDYGQVRNRPQIQAQIQALKIQGFLTEEEETSVDCGMILRFVRSSLGRRMKDAFLKESLYREQPFIIGVPAKEIKAEWNSEELVLVQGIIDVWFEEEDGLVLADYKTDYTIDPSGEELVQKYKTQLEYYRKALSQVTGKPVKEAWIYSFWLGKAISVRMLSEKVKETGVEISGR